MWSKIKNNFTHKQNPHTAQTKQEGRIFLERKYCENNIAPLFFGHPDLLELVGEKFQSTPGSSHDFPPAPLS